MINQSIEINIDELVLHGFSARDAHRIAEVIQLELSRLFSAPGASSFLSSDSSMEKLDAGSFTLGHNAGLFRAGSNIAHTIYTGLKGNNTVQE